MTTQPLGDVADLVRGVAFAKEDKRHEYADGLIACLRTTNVQRTVEWDDLWFVPQAVAKRDDQIVRSGDILISTANSYELVGKVAMVTSMPHRSTLGAFISLIRPKPHILASYLYYQLSSHPVQAAIRACASTTTNISNVSTKKLAAIDVTVADEATQAATVAYLDEQLSRLDASVAALLRAQANLKRYRASVLKAACEGRLVPTEAELARADGRTFETGAELLQRNLVDYRAHKAKQGKRGEPIGRGPEFTSELPAGWAWANLEQLSADVRNGYGGKPEGASGTRILRISAVRALAIDVEDVRFLPGSADQYATDLVAPNDLLFTRYNGSREFVGVCAVVPLSIKPTAHPDKLIKVQTLSHAALPQFVALMASSGQSRKHLESRMRTTAGQSGISGSDLKSMPIPLPPFAEQHRIVAEADRRLSLIRGAEAQVRANLARAKRLRQSILQAAFAQPGSAGQ